MHDPHQIAEPHVTEVSEGIFAYIQPDGGWWINNTGFLTGRRGVVSIDSCATELRTRRYIDAITRVSAQPVRTVINTHHHGDHTNGNYLFHTATVVGHERSRDAVLATGLPNYRGVWNDIAWGDLELSPPFLTYSDRITVWADEVRCEVSHVGIPAHTTNDSIIWIPERSVLFSGDLLFNGGTPFLLMGSIAGAITAVSNLLDLGAATIVPGHGEVTGPDVIDDVLGYLHFVQAVARQGVDAALTPLQAATECDLGPYSELLDAERIVGNLHRAYSELRGEPLGAPIDVAAALADMVEFNGGQPLSCLA